MANSPSTSHAPSACNADTPAPMSRSVGKAYGSSYDPPGRTTDAVAAEARSKARSRTDDSMLRTNKIKLWLDDHVRGASVHQSLEIKMTTSEHSLADLRKKIVYLRATCAGHLVMLRKHILYIPRKVGLIGLP